MPTQEKNAESKLVSVIIPCYNAERWISSSIQSCINQTYRHVEVVIIDDGSTDASVEVVKRCLSIFEGMNIRYFQQSHAGACAARNKGVQMANGAMLLFLDADDMLEPLACETLVAVLQEGADVAYGNAYVIDSVGVRQRIKNQAPHCDDPFIVMLENAPWTPTALFRRLVLVRCPWKHDLVCCQELDVFVNCALQGFKFRFTTEFVASVREHDSPTRITNKTGAQLPETLAWLHAGFRQSLEARAEFFRRRRIAMSYARVEHAISLLRRGNRGRALQLCSVQTRLLAFRSARFRLGSYPGIAVVLGLHTAHAAWVLRSTLKHRRSPRT